MKPSEAQVKAIGRILLWRKIHWGSVLFAMPAVLALIGAGQQPGWWPYAIPPAIALGVYAVSWYRVNRARCPRCGDFFFARKGPLGPTGTSFPLQKRCQRCGMATRRPG